MQAATGDGSGDHPPPPLQEEEKKAAASAEEEGNDEPADPIEPDEPKEEEEEEEEEFPLAEVTILYSHGNAEDLGVCAPVLKRMAKQLKVNIVAYDYVGYGHSHPGLHHDHRNHLNNHHHDDDDDDDDAEKQKKKGNKVDHNQKVTQPRQRVLRTTTADPTPSDVHPPPGSAPVTSKTPSPVSQDHHITPTTTGENGPMDYHDAEDDDADAEDEALSAAALVCSGGEHLPEHRGGNGMAGERAGDQE